MAETFKNKVYVSDPETGQSAWFEPGDECPEWAEDLVDPANFEGNEQDPESGSGEDEGVYSGMKVDELKELLEDRGLPTSGAKAELIARLESNDSENSG